MRWTRTEWTGWEVDGMKQEAESTGEAMHDEKSGCGLWRRRCGWSSNMRSESTCRPISQSIKTPWVIASESKAKRWRKVDWVFAVAVNGVKSSVLNSARKYWTVQQNDSCATMSSRLKEHWVTLNWLKALADNESVIHGTDSNSLSGSANR